MQSLIVLLQPQLKHHLEAVGAPTWEQLVGK